METIDKGTGEIIGSKDTAAIRPVFDTLRVFPAKMDDAAKMLHDAMDAVNRFQKSATVTITVSIEPFKSSSGSLVDAPAMISVECTTKLPKPEPEKQIFYRDEEGNPTRIQTRQRDLGFGVSAVTVGGVSVAGAAAA